MSSFYGGKQGRTYHIVQRYNSVADMVAAFSGGGAYSDVNYGQYVIIDTILVNHNKTSPQNGLLYRRGFDYNDNPDNYSKPNKNDSIYYDGQGNFKEEQWNTDWSNWVKHPGAGAIYVGQIVGPQGQTPEIVLKSWEELNRERGREAKTIVPASTTFGDNQNPVLDADGNIRKYSDNTPIWYGDLVKVGSYTTVDDYGNVNGAQLAFDIPRPVLKTQVVNTNPYLVSTVTENAASTAHPFYYKWDFEIPGGKHGQDIKEIVKQTVQEINRDPLNPNPITIDGENVFSGDEYLTYTITNYDNGQSGDTDAEAAASTAHLGRWPYRVINEINPVLKVRGNVITWSSNYTPEIGDLYRENDYDQDIYWVCVKSGSIDSDNDKPKKANANMANLGFEDASLGESVWRVVNIPQTTPAHSLDIDYKAGPNDIVPGLRNIDYITIDKNGRMYVFYTDSNTPYYLTTLNSLDYIIYHEPGKEGTTEENKGYVGIRYFGKNEQLLYNPKIINKIEYKNQNNIEQSQYFTVTFDDDSFRDISKPFNNVVAIEKEGDNIYFLYSDPAARANIPPKRRIQRPWIDKINKDQQGNPIQYDSLTWYNFGPLGAQYHVQGVYTYNDLLPGGLLQNGFDGIEGLKDRAGWLVTVIEEHIEKQKTLDTEINPNKTYYIKDENTQEYQEVIEPDLNDIDSYYQDKKVNVPRIFAFDYTELEQEPNHLIPNGQGGTVRSHWYEIMSLTASALDPNFFVSISDDQTNSRNNNNYTDPSKLSTNGLWFVVSYGHDQRGD